MRREDVHAELADVVCGRTRAASGRRDHHLRQHRHCAAGRRGAALVYERALATGAGLAVDFAGPAVPVGAPAFGIAP